MELIAGGPGLTPSCHQSPGCLGSSRREALTLAGVLHSKGSNSLLSAHSVPGTRCGAPLIQLTTLSAAVMTSPALQMGSRAEITIQTGRGEAQPASPHTFGSHTGHLVAWGHILAREVSRVPKDGGLAGRRLSQLNENLPTSALTAWHRERPQVVEPAHRLWLEPPQSHPWVAKVPPRRGTEKGPSECLLPFFS